MLIGAPAYTAIEAIPKKRREVIAGKYLVQYTFSACSSASAVPLMEAIGIGPSSTISKSQRFLRVILQD
jgi:hypothetical protein